MKIRVNSPNPAGQIGIKFANLTIQQANELKDIVKGFCNNEILHYNFAGANIHNGLYIYTVWGNVEQYNQLKELLEGEGFTIL